MVDAIAGFVPLTYLNQIKGIASVPAPTPSPAPTPAPSPAAALPATPPLSSTLGIPSDVLSLLQGTSGSNPLSSLFGNDSSSGGLSSLLGIGNNGSSSDPLSGLYDTLLSTTGQTAALQQAVASAQQQQADANTQTSPTQSLLQAYNTAQNAYNQVIQQNAQSVLTAIKNTPLVA